MVSRVLVIGAAVLLAGCACNTPPVTTPVVTPPTAEFTAPTLSAPPHLYSEMLDEIKRDGSEPLGRVRSMPRDVPELLPSEIYDSAANNALSTADVTRAIDDANQNLLDTLQERADAASFQLSYQRSLAAVGLGPLAQFSRHRW